MMNALAQAAHAPQYAGQQSRPALDTGALAARLRAEYDNAERARSMVNLRWLDDLRQYRGMYSPEVLTRLNKTKRARVYYRMSQSVLARLINASDAAVRAWEAGTKKPGGPSNKLLHLLDQKGLALFL